MSNPDEDYFGRQEFDLDPDGPEGEPAPSGSTDERQKAHTEQRADADELLPENAGFQQEQAARQEPEARATPPESQPQTAEAPSGVDLEAALEALKAENEALKRATIQQQAPPVAYPPAPQPHSYAPQAPSSVPDTPPVTNDDFLDDPAAATQKLMQWTRQKEAAEQQAQEQARRQAQEMAQAHDRQVKFEAGQESAYHMVPALRDPNSPEFRKYREIVDSVEGMRIVQSDPYFPITIARRVMTEARPQAASDNQAQPVTPEAKQRAEAVRMAAVTAGAMHGSGPGAEPTVRSAPTNEIPEEDLEILKKHDIEISTPAGRAAYLASKRRRT